MTTTTYAVRGMTCEHCARAVTTEVTGVPEVTSVAVDVAAGTLTVTSAAPVSDEAVVEAVEEAGYEVVLA